MNEILIWPNNIQLALISDETSGLYRYFLAVINEYLRNRKEGIALKFEQHVFKSQSFVELIEEAVSFFINSPVETLPPDEKFPGGGVYSLHYCGNFPEYKSVFQHNPDLPIYVGKAVLPGWRQARGSMKANATSLYSRLKEHSRSIDSAGNLNLKDFSCKFMVLAGPENDLISTVEASLTRKYNPLWNSYVDGFGNHDPGKGRYEQAPSEWDTLHSGRAWAERLKGATPDLTGIKDKIGKYNVKR